jgi:ADP-ribose pyrophosphatase YjhB (NUDIX family)
VEEMNVEKAMVASGPVIIEDGKLLVIMDSKDDFYKIPGGILEEDDESLIDTCRREVKEEIGGEIEIIKPLNPMVIWKNPQTKERMAIVLIHYLAKLLNKEEIKPIDPIKEIKWLDVEEIKAGDHDVAPNIKFLIEKGDIK